MELSGIGENSYTPSYCLRPFKFQTMPHAAHRQNESRVMTFASVPMAREPQSGQCGGRAGAVSGGLRIRESSVSQYSLMATHPTPDRLEPVFYLELQRL